MEIILILAFAATCGRSESTPGVMQLKSNAITTVDTASEVLTSAVRDARIRRSVFDEATKALLLDKHNELRRKPPASDMEELVWSELLAGMAEDWAKQCRWEHGQPRRAPGSVPFKHVGQNLYSSNGTFDPVGAIQMWYDEVAYYDYDIGSCSLPPCGHYTQVVWSTSRELGCAYAHCPSMMKTDMTNANYLVCNYGPTGNYIGLKPYTRGKACTACESGKFWCDDGLCRRDCTRQNTKCTCAANCHNCGSVIRENCTCRCADGWHGANCSQRCLDTHMYCGANPGWPIAWCNVSYVREYCPRMCGLCVEWTAAREQHCRETATASPRPSVMTEMKNKAVKTAPTVTSTTRTTIREIESPSASDDTSYQREENSRSKTRIKAKSAFINGTANYSWQSMFIVVIIQSLITQITYFGAWL